MCVLTHSDHFHQVLVLRSNYPLKERRVGVGAGFKERYVGVGAGFKERYVGISEQLELTVGLRGLLELVLRLRTGV